MITIIVGGFLLIVISDLRDDIKDLKKQLTELHLEIIKNNEKNNQF